MKTKSALVIPLLRQVDDWLRQCLASAVAQTVPCEVIVVTSPRTPESNREVLREFQARHAQLKVIEREPQMRFAAALNLGIRAARAERVGFLLSDDWLGASAVEKSEALEADIVSSQSRMLAADGVTVLPHLERLRTEAEYQRLADDSERANYLGHFLLFRREALLAIGGVDETIGDSPGVDDFDMLWCLLERGASVAILEEQLYHYRDHPGERLTTRRKEDMVATFHRILDKHGVAGSRRDEMYREHAEWFGKSMTEIYERRQFSHLPWLLRVLQRPYRAMVPLSFRHWFHDAILRRLL